MKKLAILALLMTAQSFAAEVCVLRPIDKKDTDQPLSVYVSNCTDKDLTDKTMTQANFAKDLFEKGYESYGDAFHFKKP